jgi:hypothetical protein
MLYRLESHFVNQKSRNVRGRRPHRQFTYAGERAAVAHAFLAARAYDAEWFSTLKAAAINAGTTVGYTLAALTLIKHGDEKLIREIRRGDISITAAAASVKYAVKLVEAYRNATRENLEAFVHKAGGPEVVFDKLVAPALTPVAKPVVTVVTPAE